MVYPALAGLQSPAKAAAAAAAAAAGTAVGMLSYHGQAAQHPDHAGGYLRIVLKHRLQKQD